MTRGSAPQMQKAALLVAYPASRRRQAAQRCSKRLTMPRNASSHLTRGHACGFGTGHSHAGSPRAAPNTPGSKAAHILKRLKRNPPALVRWYGAPLPAQVATPSLTSILPCCHAVGSMCAARALPNTHACARTPSLWHGAGYIIEVHQSASGVVGALLS